MFLKTNLLQISPSQQNNWTLIAHTKSANLKTDQTAIMSQLLIASCKLQLSLSRYLMCVLLVAETCTNQNHTILKPSNSPHYFTMKSDQLGKGLHRTSYKKLLWAIKSAKISIRAKQCNFYVEQSWSLNSRDIPP